MCIRDSFETALRHADGRAVAFEMDNEKEHLFSAKFACPICSYSLQELEPRIFSFNNPMGACPSCDGLGVIQFFDPKRIVTRPELSLAGGAIRTWDRKNQFYFQLLTSLADHYDLDVYKRQACAGAMREINEGCVASSTLKATKNSSSQNHKACRL